MNLRPETLVSPAASLLGVLSTDGRHLPADRLGPGVVREIDPEGQVLVHWTEAAADALMDPADLELLSPDAHLVTIHRLNARGERLSTRYKVVSSGLGLEHHWAVELLPKGIVRTLRSDGSSWIFAWNALLKRMNLMHNTDFPPPTSDDAEALTVAELAVY